MRLHSVLWTISLLIHGVCAAEIQDGDIIFQRSQSRQSQAISDATKSEYTHMGIVFFFGNKPFVYEAIASVTRTPLNEWINRSSDGHYIAKRLKDSTKVDLSKVRKEVQNLMGRPYDWLFAWSDDKVYCSELVWKAYKRAGNVEIGQLKTFKDFDLSSPSVRQLVSERYGKNMPMNMPVIAPSDMFDSELLYTVEER